MNSKTYFIERIIEATDLSSPRMLELACGTARYMPYILERHPDITYVGVEPFKPSFEKALAAVGDMPQVTLYNQLGYDGVEGLEPESFDIVYSVSALEHIKDLRRFIAMGAKYLKKGGLMVHRYDLGHALNSGSPKERFQVFLGNTFPKVLPEDKFVRYVPEDEVVRHCREAGCEPFDFSYHQMPNHKSLERIANARGNTELERALQELAAWEWENRTLLREIETQKRESLFPAVAVWSKKAG